VNRLTIGLIVNPVAGIGGSVALKGSDGTDIQARAREAGAVPRVPERTLRALKAIGEKLQQIDWLTCDGSMGRQYLVEAGCSPRLLPGVHHPANGATKPEDTRQAAREMVELGVDLLVFTGGDGTARDLLEAIGDRVPVVGIPGGVKMHSGVFATTPEQAGELIGRLIDGGLVNAVHRQVRDLDEAALRRGELRPRLFGELKVSEEGGYLQHTKERGRENEDLAVLEIVADVLEHLTGPNRDVNEAVVLGPGSTVAAIKHALGFEGTLLGFDVWRQGACIALDVDGNWLEENLDRAVVVLSFTRGQGFLLGRGNQQLTPEFLRRIGRQSIWIVGTRTKLKSLDGRPLLLDTNDPELDRAWSGLVEIISGYEDRLIHRLSGGGVDRDG
jgi:predicted polyphosphate/ATP-dependent NAD kinase